MIAQPTLRPVPHKAMYRFAREDYAVESKGVLITIPIAFRYNGASVPPCGWQATYYPTHPVVMVPSGAHDWLYTNHQVPRKLADDIFYDLLIRNGADQEAAWIMWQAVVLFGGPAWERTERDLYELRRLYQIIRRRPNFEAYHFPMEVL